MAITGGGAALEEIATKLAALEGRNAELRDELAALREELAALSAAPGPEAVPAVTTKVAGMAPEREAEAADGAAWFERQLEPLRLLAELDLPMGVGMSLVSGGRRFEVAVRKRSEGDYTWWADETDPKTQLRARDEFGEALQWTAPLSARYGDPVEAFDAALARIAKVLLPDAPDRERGLSVGAVELSE